MKRVFAALIIFAVLLGVSIVHAAKITNLAEDILSVSHKAEEDFNRNDWNGVRDKLEYVQKEWEANHFWTHATLSTKQIDEIEISLNQSMEYSKLESKEDFSGEFKMFCLLIEHLPKQEAFSIGELL